MSNKSGNDTSYLGTQLPITFMKILAIVLAVKFTMMMTFEFTRVHWMFIMCHVPYEMLDTFVIESSQSHGADIAILISEIWRFRVREVRKQARH